MAEVVSRGVPTDPRDLTSRLLAAGRSGAFVAGVPCAQGRLAAATDGNNLEFYSTHNFVARAALSSRCKEEGP